MFSKLNVIISYSGFQKDQNIHEETKQFETDLGHKALRDSSNPFK